MKHHTKHLAIVLVATTIVLSVFGTLAPSRATVAPSVSAYLSGLAPQTDWSVMARAAIGSAPALADVPFLKTLDGSTANDYATYILAITALGQDPRTFGNVNLVYGLRQTVSGGQIGDSTLMNDDIFGLLALVAAGVPADDPLVAQTVNYIKINQLADGGWDWSVAADTASVDYTAMAIMALVAGGVSPSDDAVFDAADYLLRAQNNDGGFPLSPGGSSNTVSTAWALSAIYAMGEDPLFWAPAGDAPIDYLNARLHGDGYFLFNASAGGADLFTPTTTSYAAIALAGKAYPVASITAPPTVNLRIEGKESTICDTQTEGTTALDVIKASAGQCGYTYVIQDTAFGPYLTTIAGEAAAGLLGWSYLPNYQSPSVGASAYQMSEGDELVWYYGAWDDKPLRVVHDVATVAAGDTTTAVVQEYTGSAWQPFAGATLSRGSEIFTTDANGQVSLSWAKDGAYYLVAEAHKHVRSNAVFVVAGEEGEQLSLPLTVTVGTNNKGGGDPDDGDGVNFGVSGDLNFGTLNPGQSGTRQATITNKSSSDITTTASVTGSTIFTGNVALNNVIPGQWQKSISASTNTIVDVRLSIPSSYSGSGQESGTLTFWAHIAQ